MIDTVTTAEREQSLPRKGRHFVGCAVADSIIVYQSLPREIASNAVRDSRFGAPFCFNRWSWIKPSFLWMMHRSNWGRLDDCVLAIHVRRQALERLLAGAVHSKYVPALYQTKRAWDRANRATNVRIQWDPDYNVHDQRLNRKAIQIGLRGDALKRYATTSITKI